MYLRLHKIVPGSRKLFLVPPPPVFGDPDATATPAKVSLESQGSTGCHYLVENPLA